MSSDFFTPFIVFLFNLTENVPSSILENPEMTYAKEKDRTEREFSLENYMLPLQAHFSPATTAGVFSL